MGFIVQKFGGTSVQDAERINRAARRAIRAKLAGHQVVVVVSAMGHTTDQLVDLANQITKNPSKREMDMLLSVGEQISIALMAMAIQSMGHDAISMTGIQVGLYTDKSHTKARIQQIKADHIFDHLNRGQIVIVAGFQGVNEEGDITTLGRGGSDTTAVALAAVLKAEMCEIYTDVNGIYTADPRIVPKARKLDKVSYDEILELASLGAGVMHSRSIEFGKKYGVPIHVRSSLTDEPGSLICEETKEMEEIAVRGVTVKKDLARVTFLSVPDKKGIAATIFGVISSENIVVDDIIQNPQPDGTANLSFTVEMNDFRDAKNVAEKLIKEVGGKGVVYDDQVAKVSIVGIGMRSHTGVAAKMFQALAAANVNIHNISTSEIKISCIINRAEADEALRRIHTAFGLDAEDDK
ncbi:MAG: aspartate kinase [Phycisphaerae bacterium]